MRNITTLFPTDEIPMLIFSYIWTSNQATKRIREINSKGKNSIDKKALFEQFYAQYFVKTQSSKPEPLMDVEFDDFEEFEFMQYKDVRIHSMEIYENGPYICGMEVYYIVDGEILKYMSHHKTKKAQKIGA